MVDATPNLVVEMVLCGPPANRAVSSGDRGERRPAPRDRESHLQRILALHQGKRVCVREVSEIRDSESWLLERAHLTDVGGKVRFLPALSQGAPPEIPNLMA